MREKKKSRTKTPAEKQKSKKIIETAIIAIIFISITLILSKDYSPIAMQLSEKQTAVYFIDCAQGDCAALVNGNSATLIDCGMSEQAFKITNTLKKLKISTVENIFFSHLHSDHIGGALEIIKSFDVKNIYYNGENESANFTALKKLMKHKKIASKKLQNGTTIDYADFHIVANTVNAKGDDKNDTSAVLSVKTKGKTFLFPGDLTVNGEKAYLEKFNAKCDILKLCHHGSKISSSENFIKNANPSFCVASCGFYNKYRHPAGKTLKTLKNTNAKLLRTDINGNIGFIIENEDISVWVQKENE